MSSPSQFSTSVSSCSWPSSRNSNTVYYSEVVSNNLQHFLAQQWCPSVVFRTTLLYSISWLDVKVIVIILSILCDLYRSMSSTLKSKNNFIYRHLKIKLLAPNITTSTLRKMICNNIFLNLKILIILLVIVIIDNGAGLLRLNIDEE